MTDPTPPDADAVPLSRTSRHLTVVGTSILALLATWVIWQFGGFDLMTTVTMDGRGQSVANTFATVDHPFHAVRAETLLQSLRGGEPLRWIAHHQGGYPVEFYPLGIPWLDVGLWALLLGQMPIIAVHKLTVLIVFVAPAIAFWWFARGDRLNPFVPVLALAIHVVTPGLWTNGGMVELIEWGLVANVGGSTLAFIALAALARFALEGEARFGVAAMLASSAALYANTRSGIAIGIAALAIVIGAALNRDPDRPTDFRQVVGRVALAGFVSVLLTAPLLLAMLRYADLYYFVNYNEYIDLRDYWNETLASVSRPMLAVAVVGVALATISRRLSVLRIVAATAVLYVGLTIVLSSGGLDQGFIQQLETPRLMPFQRLLTIYLAAAAIGYLLDVGVQRVLPRYRSYAVSAFLLVGVAVAFWTFDGEYGRTPEALVTTPEPHALTTGRQEFVEFSAILAEAGEIVPAGQAIYVVGDQQSWWHEQLWGPSQADAPFFYDDWMWYWHPDFDAPYDFEAGHFIPDPASTFTPEWLTANGIGALVVTTMPGSEDPKDAAVTNTALEFQVAIGAWDLYLVRDAGSIVTNGVTQPTALSIENETIVAEFEAAEGAVEIRRNWFPRWEAFADGEPLDVTRTASGYMEVGVPANTQSVELRYAVTGVDWLGRFAALLGVAAIAAFGSGLRWRARVGRRSGHLG